MLLGKKVKKLEMDKMRTPLFVLGYGRFLDKKIRKKICKNIWKLFGNGQNAHPLIVLGKQQFLASCLTHPNPFLIRKKSKIIPKYLEMDKMRTPLNHIEKSLFLDKKIRKKISEKI